MLRESKNIIKANPGFYILEPIAGDNGKISELGREEIIAWSVDATYKREGDVEGYQYSLVHPITVTGTEEGDGWAILKPSGSVFNPKEETWFNSQEDYLTDIQNKEREKAKERIN